MQNKSKVKLKTKCVKINFYKCVHFLLFSLLSTLWIYHFHCFPISFLLLYLSFHLDSPHRHPNFPHFRIFTQIPDPDFKKIVTLAQKRILPCCYYWITLGIKSLFASSETSSVISQKKNVTLSFLKSIICEVWANNYEWMKCYLRFMSKRSTTFPKLSIFVICANLKKYIRNYSCSKLILVDSWLRF